MSASLRDRLKRTGRCFKSPAVIKSRAEESSVALPEESPTKSEADKKAHESHKTIVRKGNGFKTPAKVGTISKTGDAVLLPSTSTKVNSKTPTSSLSGVKRSKETGKEEDHDFKILKFTEDQGVLSHSQQIGETDKSALHANSSPEIIELRDRLKTLQRKVSQKEETLRKLKMVKMYRSKVSM